jgi:hypothetical protein
LFFLFLLLCSIVASSTSSSSRSFLPRCFVFLSRQYVLI